MHQLAATLILLWGIVGAPALCAAGVLLHACPGDQPPDCAHEERCAADPCVDVALASPLSRISLQPQRTEEPAAAGGGAAAIHEPASMFRAPLPAPPVPSHPNLPVPASALPLLN